MSKPGADHDLIIQTVREVFGEREVLPCRVGVGTTGPLP